MKAEATMGHGMIGRALIAAIALATAASAQDVRDDDEDHLVERKGVRVLHAWTPAGEGDARVFLEIENTGDAPVSLVGGRTDADGEVTIMASPIRPGGEPEAIPALPIGPREMLALEPDGVYLLLESTGQRLARGDSFSMQLEIEPVGHVEINVDVEAEDATDHSHSGHSH